MIESRMMEWVGYVVHMAEISLSNFKLYSLDYVDLYVPYVRTIDG
jgi:hypothetical protein